MAMTMSRARLSWNGMGESLQGLARR